MNDTIPSYQDREAFLEHYGVPGMRWGKRRAAKSVDTTPDDPDFTAARATLKKPIRKVSNQELQQLQTRMNLERPYSQVKKAGQPTTKVKNVITGVLALGATAGSLYGLYNSKHGQMAINLGKKAVSNYKGVRAGAAALGGALG